MEFADEFDLGGGAALGFDGERGTPLRRVKVTTHHDENLLFYQPADPEEFRRLAEQAGAERCLAALPARLEQWETYRRAQNVAEPEELRGRVLTGLGLGKTALELYTPGRLYLLLDRAPEADGFLPELRAAPGAGAEIRCRLREPAELRELLFDDEGVSLVLADGRVLAADRTFRSFTG